MSSGFQRPGFQPNGFQTEQEAGSIVQTLPSLTQAMTATTSGIVIPELPSEVLGRMFRFRPPNLALMAAGEIHQTLPSLTQSMTVDVNDDELVLLLV